MRMCVCNLFIFSLDIQLNTCGKGPALVHINYHPREFNIIAVTKLAHEHNENLYHHAVNKLEIAEAIIRQENKVRGLPSLDEIRYYIYY
jgi:hypothetical protein